MNTPEKEKKMTKSAIDRGTFVRAMAEFMLTQSTDLVKVPVKYRDQVIVVKEILKSDVSGLVNNILDFAINCALVNYSVETSNENLTALFEEWLKNLNSDLRGKIPVGLSALAKQYFQERWKGSSFIILRTLWEEKDGYIVPTKLWFVEGEDIIIDNKSETVAIGSEKYLLKTSSKTSIKLPASKDERIFVQKPYESWGTEYPTPYAIRRGLYRNLRLMDILASKVEFIVGKALEYLLLLKKGTENLALAGQPEFVYSNEDLLKVKENLETVLSDRRQVGGPPTYATNFDTEISHLIPDYSLALKQELYAPIERRIMAGMGFVDVLQGVASTRKESVLNPRPFVAEVQHGIEDFKMLLSDVMQVMIELNAVKHPKHFGNIIKIHSTPITHFFTDEMRTQLRSMYDRGVLSKKTYAEVVGDLDYDVEFERRKAETPEVEDIMFPPVINNIDEQMGKVPPSDKKVTPDKKGPEAKNYKASESGESKIKYASIEDLSHELKIALPAEAQTIWFKAYTESVSKGEAYAEQVAWAVTKKFYKKSNNIWVSKKELSSEDLLDEASVDKELKLAQLKLAKKFLNLKEE